MTDRPSGASVSELATVTELDLWRQRAAWAAAAVHLNDLGLAAAVPAQLVAALRRQGLEVWATEGRAA